jgi:hypothetical protein
VPRQDPRQEIKGASALKKRYFLTVKSASGEPELDASSFMQKLSALF